MVGGGDGDESADAFDSTETLKIVARDEASHAKTYQVKGIRKILIGVRFDLTSELVESHVAVVGMEIGHMWVVAVVFEVGGKFIKNRTAIPKSMNEKNVFH